uniref:non-specific serine/threonine protein kinase n=1 Tax=Quercus lobata TaxID=97700 RepID=A0A7N2N946_QUELO
MGSPVLFLLFSLAFSFPLSSSAVIISKGTSLSVEKPDILTSPNGDFSAGFYSVGDNAYCFAIWFSNSRTVVWMANRDQPVNGKRSKLSLLNTGNLILTDANKLNVNVWATNTVSLSSVQLFLNNTGNLVLRNKEHVLWQSFDFPTDTLLPEQLFTRKTKLVSSRSQTNISSGFYELSFYNNSYLQSVYNGPNVSRTYYYYHYSLLGYYNSSTLVFNSLGNFSSYDHLTIISVDYGAVLHRRLTLDYDGNIRLYSWEEEGKTWVVSWQGTQRPCKIPGACGANSLCSYDIGSGKKCSCAPGYKMKNRSDWADGCEPEKSLGVDKQGHDHAAIGFRKFTYTELKKATKSFTEEIGRGAGGIVYKGVLFDKRVAAIKRLNEVNQGESEFLSEVSIIGRINHMNLIEMWGYCVEGKHRLLVYEYMEHGSLANNLSTKALDWEKRFKIAIGTAKGLAYLHEDCLDWILLCDVKPQNILLDSTYQPKVADFGLSKLQNRCVLKNSSFSRMRGTRGYMAPEWVFNMPITSKVDVYSYGIVVLEMVTGKSPSRNVHAINDDGEAEHKMLVTWVREKMKKAASNTSSLEEIIDPMLEGKHDMVKMKALVQVSLQCVEEDKDARPTMSQVVEMLIRQEKIESHVLLNMICTEFHS